MLVDTLESYPFKFPSFSIPYIRAMRAMEDRWVQEALDQAKKQK